MTCQPPSILGFAGLGHSIIHGLGLRTWAAIIPSMVACELAEPFMAAY
jgi:hypothetical protein